MKTETDLESVRSDPRFPRIVERVWQNEREHERKHSDH